MAPRPKLVTRIGAGVATLAAIAAVGGALAWNQSQADATSELAVTPLGAAAEAGAQTGPGDGAAVPGGGGTEQYREYGGDDGRWYPEYEDDEHGSRYEDDSDWDDDDGWEDTADDHGERSAPRPAPSQPSSVAPSAPAAPSQGSTRTS